MSTIEHLCSYSKRFLRHPGETRPYTGRVEKESVSRRTKHAMLTKKEIGLRLRGLRDEQGMTQVELAEAMGIHQTSLSQMERGIRGVGTKQILKVCRALRVSPDRLLGATSKETLSVPPRNTRLLRRLRTVERLPLEHQEAVVKMLDAFLGTRVQGNGRR